MSFKKTLVTMLGYDIDAYEMRIASKEAENESLATMVAKATVANERMQKELDFYKKPEEEKVALIMEQADDLAKLYKARIAECEQTLLDYDRVMHREFAKGRQCAYAEMGIRNLEAKKKGNELVATWDDTDLIDIVELPAEIEIDDLVEVEA